MDFTDIKRLRVTTSDTEADKLLQDGWTLYDIEKSGSRYTFLLVQI
ncbi:hypothetical protein [Brevibacillus massiliensis]|nr:hypothetical protein [Brevibacillus massiliensis]